MRSPIMCAECLAQAKPRPRHSPIPPKTVTAGRGICRATALSPLLAQPKEKLREFDKSRGQAVSQDILRAPGQIPALRDRPPALRSLHPCVTSDFRAHSARIFIIARATIRNVVSCFLELAVARKRKEESRKQRERERERERESITYYAFWNVSPQVRDLTKY